MYRNFVNKLNRVNSGIVEASKWLGIAIYTVLMVCLIFQVIARFVLKIPAPWTEELARTTFVMVTYLGCGVTMHYGKHTDMSLFDTVLEKTKNPKKSFFIMKKVTMSASLIFIAYFCAQYYPFLMKIKNNGKMLATVPVPTWIVMSSVLIGLILMGWEALVQLLQPYEGNEQAD